MSNRPSNHRQSRSRRGFDDEGFGGPDLQGAATKPAVSWPAPPSQGYVPPSYAGAERSTARPAVSADRTGIKAVVKWYNTEKGFGFVATEEGADVFIHNAVVRAAGHEELVANARLVVDVAKSDRGDKVVNLVSVEAPDGLAPQGPRPASSAGESPRARAGYVADPVGNITGTVKWFNTEKGFGFVAPDGGGKDVFVHASALERSGIATLREGARISADVVTGRSGKTEVGTLKML